MSTSRIAIIGTGYVGLTTGACLAELGHDVVCADVDADKVARLSAGEIPIHEDGLERIVADNIASGRLRFTLDASNAVGDREFVYLCLPTPQGSDGSADLSYLEAAAEEIATHLAPGAVVINKSTVPVGSTTLVHRALGRSDVSVVSNPEFLREGSAVSDFMNPDRVVIGSDDRGAASRVASLYLGTRAPILVTGAPAAETIKYAANAFLAAKLSFVNDVAALCETVGADIDEVVLGMGYDRRIGHDFLKPGPGWGGSCFPKDTHALLRIAQDAGHDFSLLRSVVSSNETQFERVVDKIAEAGGGDLSAATVAVLGLTFKAGTDDLRESPSLRIIESLLFEGAKVKAYDPTVHRSVLDGGEVTTDAYSACEGADVVAVLTEWSEFRSLNLDKVAEVMRGTGIVDARNMLDPKAVRRRGLSYTGVGRR